MRKPSTPRRYARAALGRATTPRIAVPPDDGTPLWIRRAAGMSWRLLVILAVVVLAVYAMSHVQLLFIGVFLALVVSSLLRPLVNLFDRRLPRALAVLFALLVAIAGLGALVTFVVQSVVGQWSHLAEQFTQGIQDLLTQLQHLPFGISISNDQIRQWIAAGEQWVQQHQQDLVDRAASGAGSLFGFLAMLALATFCTVFFLARGTQMWDWFVN